MLGYNYLNLDKCGPLITMCDVFDFSNLVKTATCFTKIAEPSLLDVIITYRKIYFHKHRFDGFAFQFDFSVARQVRADIN
jgi:hypothetical protein